MSTKSDPFGVCPKCGAEMYPRQILVEYETDEGETNRFVECSSCEGVFKPE